MPKWPSFGAVAERSPWINYNNQHKDPQVGDYECGYLSQTAALALGSSILAGVNATSISEARALDYNTILDYVSDAGLSFGIEPSLDYYAISNSSLRQVRFKLRAATGIHAQSNLVVLVRRCDGGD